MSTNSSVVKAHEAKAGFVKIALVAMLLFALNDSNPYGYYQLLRWACFGVFAYLAYDASTRGSSTGWTWIFGMFALLYNPFLPMALGREVWEVVNVATAAVLAFSMWSMRTKKHRSQ